MKSLKTVMVRTIIMVLFLVVWGIPLFAGGASEQSNPAKTDENTKPVFLTFATQDVGSAMYTYASAIAGVILPALPQGSNIDVTTTSPGAVGAPIIVEKGDCDLTMGNTAPAKWAAETGILGNPPTTKVRSIAGGMGINFINVLFTQSFVDKTGIKTVEEVITKKYPIRIAIKANGAFGELACAKVLEVLGVNYDMVRSWGGTVTQTGTDAIVSLLKDGKADLTIDHVGAGQAATTELCMTTAMYFPELSTSTRAKLNSEGFDNVDIPATTWKGQTNTIKSVGSPQVVLCSAELDDDTVYRITKGICENKETLVQADASLKYFDPVTAWDPLKTGAKLHPGAERYYRDKGYIK
jgi:TRAP transporter TAXI family solute receptor